MTVIDILGAFWATVGRYPKNLTWLRNYGPPPITRPAIVRIGSAVQKITPRPTNKYTVTMNVIVRNLTLRFYDNDSQEQRTT